MGRTGNRISEVFLSNPEGPFHPGKDSANSRKTKLLGPSRTKEKSESFVVLEAFDGSGNSIPVAAKLGREVLVVVPGQMKAVDGGTSFLA